MRISDYLRHTVTVSIPAVVAGVVAFYALGYAELACGLLLGVAGGVGKSYLLSYQAVYGQRSLWLFLMRYSLVALVFIAGILVSMQAFFAVVAGLFFVHVVFISDLARTDNTEETG